MKDQISTPFFKPDIKFPLKDLALKLGLLSSGGRFRKYQDKFF